MAKKNNKMIIGIIVVLVLLALGFNSTQIIEPNDYHNYDFNQLSSILGLGRCSLYDADFYDDFFLQCDNYNIKSDKILNFQIQSIWLWSEGQYTSCSEFFAGNPHSYKIGVEPPCYMEEIEGSNFILFQDFSLPFSLDRNCIEDIVIPYYSCSKNDLFIISGNSISLFNIYHNNYVAGIESPSAKATKDVKFFDIPNDKKGR